MSLVVTMKKRSYVDEIIVNSTSNIGIIEAYDINLFKQSVIN